MTMGKSDSNPLYSRSTYSHFPGRGGGRERGKTLSGSFDPYNGEERHLTSLMSKSCK